MAPEPRPPLASYEDLARLFDYPLVRPDLSSTQVAAGLDLAKRYKVAAAIVRPADIEFS